MKIPARNAVRLVLLAGVALCLAAPSFADPPPHPDHHSNSHGAPPPSGGPRFSGQRLNHTMFSHTDFAHFSPQQHSAWVGGRWNHGWHHGRFGWWWFAGGDWYFYDEPVYPYPGYVSDYYVDDDSGYGAGMWYYCQNPPGYYPYVQQCGTPWQPVPPSPPPPPPSGNYGPPPGYGNSAPPPGYQGGPPPDDNQGPPPSDDRYPDYQGPPPGGPGPGNQGPPPVPGPNGPQG